MYYLTVDWCNQGRRGIFCDAQGSCYKKDEPHTPQEMRDILGPFALVLEPRSELFTDEQLSRFTYWKPLAEYKYQFGIAME